jgi:hypothetical protein
MQNHYAATVARAATRQSPYESMDWAETELLFRMAATLASRIWELECVNGVSEWELTPDGQTVRDSYTVLARVNAELDARGAVR